MIPLFEELALNAWPAVQTVLYDGWVLRFADGYTRRSNSVSPLYASSLPLDEKIAACERWYRARRLPVIFKLTADSQPRGLDSALEGRGYLADAHTSVQRMDLIRSVVSTGPGEMIWFDTPAEAWVSEFCRLSCIDEPYFAPMRQILNLIAPEHCFGMLRVDGKPVACGLVVCQDGHVGFYDILVDASQRRQGYGQCLMEHLMAWGQRQGAQTAYLQVMMNNDPALRLYARLGFQEIYRYWYRVKKGE